MTIDQGPRFRALAYACVLGLLVPWWIATCTRTAQRRALILATTTSVSNSGLLDALLPSFRGDSGLEVLPQPIGSGLALRMLAAGQADVALTHAPDAEAAALAKHPRWFYRKLMFNDFVIVGPANDPSLVAPARSAPDAFRRIVASHALFISRGDGSGTEERETLLWKLAGVTPARDQRVIAGAGMGATLRIADQMKGYTLSDRATFAQNAHALAARLLFQGDPQLLNTYSVVHDNNARAEAFAEWLLRGRGRALIAAYRIGGQPHFRCGRSRDRIAIRTICQHIVRAAHQFGLTPPWWSAVIPPVLRTTYEIVGDGCRLGGNGPAVCRRVRLDCLRTLDAAYR